MTTAILFASGCLFWFYRGTQVFIRQSVEFAPTPYDATGVGRQRLAQATRIAQRVGWQLEDGSHQNAFYLPPQNGSLIIFAHGSPGDGLFALEEGRILAERGYGVLLVDLPGYGLSEGNRAWDASFVESIRRAIDFAQTRPEIGPHQIGGFGYSNGGCLIARVAAEDERLAAIVLLASYSNLADQLHHANQRRTPLLGYVAIAASLWAGVPVSELDTVAALRRMTPRPTLIMAGRGDLVIPIGMAEQLKGAVPGARNSLLLIRKAAKKTSS